MKKYLGIAVSVALAFGCASTPQGRLHQAGTSQKIIIDGTGNTYLDVCEQIVRPKCVAQSEDSDASGSPWTKDQRIACLGACRSEAAEEVKAALSGVIAAQLVVFTLLRSGDSNPKSLDEAQANLREALGHLAHVIRETGAQRLVEKHLLGR